VKLYHFFGLQTITQGHLIPITALQKNYFLLESVLLSFFQIHVHFILGVLILALLVKKYGTIL